MMTEELAANRPENIGDDYCDSGDDHEKTTREGKKEGQKVLCFARRDDSRLTPESPPRGPIGQCRLGKIWNCES